MALNRVIVAIVLALWPALASAEANDWQRYRVAETGAGVDVPRDIFSEEAGKPETGTGTIFLTSDHRANLTVQSFSNVSRDTPAAFLAKKRPPANIVYRRITGHFFVVSSFRNNVIWYNRC